MNTQFELYRYTHPDGSAKDWAYSVATVDQKGRYLVRWGKQNRLVGNQPCIYDVVLKWEREKLDKGYRHIGRGTLDAKGPILGCPKRALSCRISCSGFEFVVFYKDRISFVS